MKGMNVPRIVLLVVSLMIIVHGESGECGSDAVYELDENGVMTISGNGVMRECSGFDKTKVKEVIINKGITGIGYKAFQNFGNLASIRISDSVKSIGDNAFEYCSNLISINISNSVTSIGSYAFSHCSNLVSINISDSVTYIDSYAFSHCSNLVSINIPNNVTSILISTFNSCSKLVSIIIPNSVTSIGAYAFESCSNLASVNISSHVTRFGSYAFRSCRSLAYINIPDNITEIGDSAFESCKSLVSVNIPNSVESIGDSAFSGCNSLKLVTYCGTSTPLSCSSSKFYESGRTIAVSNDYDGDTFCGCPVTKSDFACSGCAICSSTGTCNDLNDISSLACDRCPSGYGYSADKHCTKCSAGTYSAGGTSECVECPSGEWSTDGEGKCSKCDPSCNGCNFANGKCIKCNTTSELINGACIPCRDGFVSNGIVCKEMSTMDSVIIEFEPGTDITTEMIDEIRTTVERETGYDIIISVVDNTVKISIDDADDNISIIIKNTIETCKETMTCGNSFNMVKRVSIDRKHPSMSTAAALSTTMLALTLLLFA